MLKVGYTTIGAEKRLNQIYNIVTPGDRPYQLRLEASAMRDDGSAFMDHDVHRFLRRRGFSNPAGEWFKCSVEDVRVAILALVERKDNEENRTSALPS